jgi:hypothetical protein
VFGHDRWLNDGENWFSVSSVLLKGTQLKLIYSEGKMAESFK